MVLTLVDDEPGENVYFPPNNNVIASWKQGHHFNTSSAYSC